MGRTSRARNRHKNSALRKSDHSKNNKNYNELLEWMRIAGNGWHPPDYLRLHVFSTCDGSFQLRGIMTTRPIDSDQPLINVPLNLVVTKDVALKHLLLSPPAGATASNYGLLTSHQILSLFLIEERAKGSGSAWEKYLNTLPDSYEVPCYCTDKEVQAFPPYLRCKAAEQVDLLKAKYLECKAAAVVAGDLNFALFKWAWFTVNSRGVYYPDDSDNLALAPFLDMFNHSPEVVVSAGKQDEGYHITNLNMSYRKSDQVMINYGPHGNMRLYLEYGFVLPENRDDFFPLRIADLSTVVSALLKADPACFDDSLRVIDNHSLAHSLRIEQDGSVSWNVGACLFILASAFTNPHQQPSAIMPAVFECEDFFAQKMMIKRMCLLLIDRKVIEVKQSLEDFAKKKNTSNSFKVAENLLKLHLETLERASNRFNNNYVT